MFTNTKSRPQIVGTISRIDKDGDIKLQESKVVEISVEKDGNASVLIDVFNVDGKGENITVYVDLADIVSAISIASVNAE